MDVDLTFAVIVAALLVARHQSAREVPALPLYLACGAWAFSMVARDVFAAMDLAKSFVAPSDGYYGQPSVLGFVESLIQTVAGLVLIAAAAVAARTPSRAAPETSSAPPSAPSVPSAGV